MKRIPPFCKEVTSLVEVVIMMFFALTKIRKAPTLTMSKHVGSHEETAAKDQQTRDMCRQQDQTRGV